jgi:serine/threonine protein kinase/tetratricopeptide (TPR) repeat protein
LSDALSRLQAALADHYRIERELGRGGMAIVYLAQDLRHDRPVALKVLQQEVAETLGAERFLREIKLAARLQHPHIISVHDSGEVRSEGHGPGCLWFTMPYIEGESLRDRLHHEHQLPLDEAVRITREVALALDFAHRHGIIHRDIKPENILLVDGQALVADFGIGRALSIGDAGRRESGKAGKSGGDEDTLTGTGMAVGTPAYMSPEQAVADRDIDGRTDVYSLGVVLYEMLTGEPPFGGPTAQAIAAKRMSGEVPSLRRLRPAVPEQLERVVLTALAPIPADRFSTPADFAKALTATTGPDTAATMVTPAPRPPKSSSARHRVPAIPSWLTFVLGLLVTATMGMLIWQRNRHSEPPASKMLAVLPFKNLGAPADQYFADGLTEEITSRLAGISDLGVVSRTTADQYKSSAKSIKQIGQELGVGYVLEGSVRWEKSPGGSSRVRVTPQLIRVADDRHIWAERYDAVLAEVFQVQSSIAEQVTEAMNLALEPAEQRALQERPTSNPEAYDYYLRGLTYRDRSPGREDIQNSIQMFRRAVELDSNYAQAWAKLSEGYSSQFWYFHDRTPAALVRAKDAAERALRLRSDLPDPHIALAWYHYWGHLEYDAALHELDIVVKQQPNNPQIFSAIAAVRRRQGRWPEALANFEKNARLDPRSNDAVFNLAETYLVMRKYDLALSTLDRAVAMNPDGAFGHWERLHAMLSAGASVDDARKRLREAVDQVELVLLARAAAGVGAVAGFASTPSFVLTGDPAYQPALERLTVAEFADSAGYFHLKSELYRAEKRPQLERAYLDSARTLLEGQVRAQPDEASFHSRLGLVYAELGRAADAVREGETGVRLLPVTKEAYRGVNILTALAVIYARVGRKAKALDRLEYLLSIPSLISPAILRVDPRWAPLRGEPRFEKLANRR